MKRTNARPDLVVGGKAGSRRRSQDERSATQKNQRDVVPTSGTSAAARLRTWSPLVLGLSVLAAGGATQAHAQSNGEITGVVTDSTGAVIPQATVTLTDPATNSSKQASTNNAGIFDFTGVDVGKYNLTVKVNGFQTLKKNGIVMNVAQTLKEDAMLATGSADQTVTVTADALQVQSETNEVSSLISGQQVVQLATNGRNVYSLTTLGTGVATNNPSFNGVTAQGSAAGISFNGMRPDHNNWLIDGGEVYDRGSGGKLDVMPSEDMLDEFRVLSSNYTPDYGISSGGTVLMVLKSGTKDFHGGLWEFNRNDLFDAYHYFAKQASPVPPKPELRLNIFGGAIGGPVVIPHLYNTNKTKTFFFAGEEWRRLVLGAAPSEQPTLPAADFPVAGQNFTYIPFGSDLTKQGGNTCANGVSGQGIICVPTTSDPAKLAQYAAAGVTAGAPFPNNTIPASLLDSNALLFMATGAIPKPNSGTNYIASPKQPTSVREDVVRVDQIFSEKYHLLGSWIHDQMSQVEIPTQWSGDTYSTVGDTFANPSWAAVIKLSQTLSPTLLNETSFNVNGNTISITPLGIYQQPSGWNAGSFFQGNNAGNRLPQIAFSNGPINTTYTSIYFPWHNSYLDYQVRDDLSKVWGKHTAKFGLGYMRGDKNQQLQADTQGDYQFSGTAFSQNPYTNLLLGFASNYQQLQQQRTNHYVNNTFSGYAQDDWHITQRLTLNLGFRYDALPHVYEKNNQLANFNPAAYSAANAQQPNTNTGQLDPTGAGFGIVNGNSFYLNGIQIAGTNGVPRQSVQNNYLTYQPRLGFAYDAFGDGKTVIRGGYGLFYERVQGNDTYNISTTPPFAYQPAANNIYFSSPTTSNQTGATAATPYFPAGLREENTYYPNPATQQYSFGVQQALAPSVVFGFGYVGTTGWNQNAIREINDLNFNSPVALRKAVTTGGVQVNAYRPYLGYSNIGQEENSQNFTYNSLQAQVRMEQKHGLTLQLSYTWSHEIDVQSGDLTSTTLAGSGGFLSNPYDPSYDRGSGSFDRRHIFNANYIYALPFYLHSSNGLVRNTVAGWEIAGITTAESGSPLNIYYNGSDTLGLGGNTTNRPNITGKVSYPKKQAQWFNTGVFTAPVAPWDSNGATTGFGNARKDNVVGPGLFNWNISLYKSFHLTTHEGPTFQLRAETYNTFNHTQFQNVDTGTADGTYGQVTSTYDPRTFQFGAKFLF